MNLFSLCFVPCFLLQYDDYILRKRIVVLYVPDLDLHEGHFISRA